MKKFAFRFLGFSLTLALLLGFSLLVYAESVPDAPLNARALAAPNAAVVMTDADGEPLPCGAVEGGEKADLAALPPYVPAAFVAVEDKRFYRHRGLDYRAIGRALLTDIKHGKAVEGGSTITQQLVKNTQLTSEKSVPRKIQEARLARKIEKMCGKTLILQTYLNAVYFGDGAYGLSAAARHYFAKPAFDLTLPEAALLAAVINSPATYAPLRHPAAAAARRNLVLERMRAQGYLTKSECAAASASPLGVRPAAAHPLAAYADAALAEARGLLACTGRTLTDGMTIRTYLDARAQGVLQTQLAALAPSTPNAADVPPSGVALLQDAATLGYTACAAQGDGAVGARRRPGSTLKPIVVYAPALERGIITPSTPVSDAPADFDGWSPVNFKGEYGGTVSAREALASSSNVAAVRLYTAVTPAYGRSFARRLGLDFAEDNLALPLGGTREGVTLPALVNAYAAFASGGRAGAGGFVKEITQNGAVLYRHAPGTVRVMRTDTAAAMTDMLRYAVTDGTAKKLAALPFPVAAKTGTAGRRGNPENTDAYCLSYTPAHVLGVWYGTPNSDPAAAMKPAIAGGTYPTYLSRCIWEALYA